MARFTCTGVRPQRAADGLLDNPKWNGVALHHADGYELHVERDDRHHPGYFGLSRASRPNEGIDMKISVRTTVLWCALSLSGYAFAQAPASVDSAALAAARDLVGKMQGDRSVVLQSMAAPMAGLVAQLGVKEPERAQVLVSEVILPTLSGRYDELIATQAQVYAANLALGDLQAAAAFYGSPAGKNFAAAQPKLAQAQVAAMTQFMTSVAPELQAKLSAAVQKHGWAAPARR
jgi:hypothetical protein